jgi:putative PIN family toxin of toxin-antitoxin system
VRIVLDTVVLVRGLLDPYSWSGKLLLDRTDAYEWVVSPEIVAEYLEVIRRPRLLRKYRGVENRDLKAIVARIATAILVHPAHIPAACRDPADDKFLAAAKTGDARFIITADTDLLTLGAFDDIQITTADVLLRVLDQPTP